jgi:Zc3h12a-like Ribonuclease NYN domain
MRASLVLLLFSLVGVALALTVPGWSALLLVAGPCAIASFVHSVHAVLVAPAPEHRQVRDDPPTFRKEDAPNWIIVDGSNVLYWRDNTPQLETLRDVLRHLREQGYSPGVVFDASAGYRVSDRYQDDADWGAMLGLPIDRVVVVHKGTVADLTVLAAARDLGARIVTNDRYRDWADQHPEVREPGHLIRGGYRDGALWLALEPELRQAAPRAQMAAAL